MNKPTSPLPWRIEHEHSYDADEKIPKIVDANGDILFGCQTYYPISTESVFPLIVQSVNRSALFDEMVDTLTELDRTIDKDHFYADRIKDLIHRAQEASQ